MRIAARSHPNPRNALQLGSTSTSCTALTVPVTRRQARAAIVAVVQGRIADLRRVRARVCVRVCRQRVSGRTVGRASLLWDRLAYHRGHASLSIGGMLARHERC
jgi:hypothetical protein